MSAKKSLDWKAVGQFVAVLVKLFSVIIAALKQEQVGPEVIDWVTGPGKKFFVQKLKEIATEFLLQTAPILQAEIDTNLDPRLPFDGAKIEKHARVGKVKIEKRRDGLYVGGRKVVLYRSKRQINGKTVVGHELRMELDGQLVLSASILDFLLAHPEYIPEEWKQDESGNTIYIYFWGTIYRGSGDNLDDYLYVRYLYWNGGRWNEYYCWLGDGWVFRCPVAVLASN